jgi:hypothetical protein
MAAMGDDLKLATGDSIIEYDTVTYALHVPKSADGPHGPFAVLVFFGGYGDSIEYYQKALAEMCDELDMIAVIPQMPWFAKPGKSSAAAVMGSLDGLRKEIETQFHTDTNLVIVSGASAGGGSACQLTRRWGKNVPLLVLHSTNRCSGIGNTRSVLLVGENEAGFLGSEAEDGKLLGQGLTDLFAVPKEQHEVHFRHMRVWLETELSAVRIERSDSSAKPDLNRAINLLLTPVPDTDAFFKYQQTRRAELRTKCQSKIDALRK